MAEDDGAEHDLFGEALGFGLDHHHGAFGAGDHQVQLRAFHLGAGRVQQVLAILVADAGGADRAAERNARQRHGRRGADQRGDIRIDGRIQRQHGRDHLHIVVEAIREQRPQRAVDEARGQGFLLGRTALALEEAAGDLARGVGLLDVVDGEGEEIAARHRLRLGNAGHQDDGVPHGNLDRCIGLTGEFAGLDRYGLAAVSK